MIHWLRGGVDISHNTHWCSHYSASVFGWRDKLLSFDHNLIKLSGCLFVIRGIMRSCPIITILGSIVNLTSTRPLWLMKHISNCHSISSLALDQVRVWNIYTKHFMNIATSSSSLSRVRPFIIISTSQDVSVFHPLIGSVEIMLGIILVVTSKEFLKHVLYSS